MGAPGRGARDAGIAYRGLPDRPTHGTTATAAERSRRSRGPRLARSDRRESAQPARHRCPAAAQALGLHHRRVGLRQIDPAAGCPASGAAQTSRSAVRGRRRTPRTTRRRVHHRCRIRRPGGDRTHRPFQPCELCRRLRCAARAFRETARGTPTRLDGRYLQLQLRHRSMSDLQRQRLRACRDAVPVGCLPPLRRLQRYALSHRDA